MSKDAREISLERAKELKGRISDFLEKKEEVDTGLKLKDEIQKRKQKVMELFNATEEDWQDWKWHTKNRISDSETLGKILNLSDKEKEEIDKIGEQYRWAVSPYYVSLMDPNDPMDPVRRQSVPTAQEMVDKSGKADPMGEEYTNPSGSITRRYPDRLIINVTNQCAMYCRHCQRRRNIGEVDKPTPQEELEESIDYIKNSPEIRDVLLTGGDAFMLSDEKIDWILTELRKIPHVEIIRLGSRTPVTMPMRVTENLCNVLSKHMPIYVNTHYNHPKEITEEARDACFRLAKAGVSIGNQAVLLNKVNNNPHVMKILNHELLKIMVRPYYIFHAKEVVGTKHFITRVEEGLEILEHLRGYTSGMAIPTYLINAPEGHGKTPMLPQYLISMGKDKIKIRTWENKVFEYPNSSPSE
ncbi:glutamate 2,3-aminomutase [Natranaerofaba carboxydovora]|uniref:glutamate 2,3-aminomutase n=1 Tax=Natranaerofaba carboxydovora TaxID=2742683 RepID=UPI001F132A23|nr:glutamate 2,3-aminomutase [Natranaerofaba carboxydovora]UMZ73345.1 Glutamate 2,3-aminomutase [Natranaerofaba carboxydovora]